MRFRSTAGGGRASFRTALFQGLAPDGGLYQPVLPGPAPWAAVRRAAGVHDRSLLLARHLLADEIPDGTLDAIVAEALDFPAPVVPLEDGLYVLELFHGPTLSFKDFGARFQARAMQRLRRDEEGPRTVLVATSGDTGSAVGNAFHGLEGFRVIALFPERGVSAAQRRQLTTLGGNVTAAAVSGVFDDCQRLVKEALRAPELCARFGLTSANSINVGRLLPQIFYYFHGVAELAPRAGPPLIAVPSGNFGNLAAGLFGLRLGLPAAGFAAATNRNDVVPAYLRTGEYHPRPSVRTLSNAMDVGSPSNLERIRLLYGDRLERLRADVTASSHDDEATLACIRAVWQRTGYLLDPHSAVGYLGLREAMRERGHGGPGLLLATAHPAKFPEVVERATGVTLEPPATLAASGTSPERFVRVEPSLPALGALLEAAPAT